MLREILAVQFRLLTFRKTIEALPDAWWRYLGYVVLVTWIVGIGRYWDDPDAYLVQNLGIASLLYLFAMSAVLWAAIAPLADRSIPYVLIVIFVGMTALPAVLYAIPVEMFMASGSAAAANYLFLAVVAIWRVALLFVFCRRAAGLYVWGTMTAAFLPLTGIMILLATFSLEHVTFDLMSGMRVDETHPRTTAGRIASDVTAAVGWSHATVSTLSFFSWILFPIFFISYICLLVNRMRQVREPQPKN